jgi:drug/metabolite transporter (DMT)-like permease
MALVNASIICFTINNVFGKKIMSDPEMPATFAEFTFFRCVFMAFAALLEMYGERRNIWQVPQICRRTLVIRCVVGSGAFLMTTEGLKLIPLSFFVMIINTSPFVTAIL